MQSTLKSLYDNIRGVILGKDEVVRMALTALVARGHVLIEDAPGLGKTMLARAIAQSLDSSFKRIQFTPDLLPSDVTGVSVYHPEKQQFEFHPGPVFTQVLLADEINRTSPRTQAALLEAMEEHQVTVDGSTHMLPEPFFVLATQNPIELDGTYPLPEAQVDRFLMRLELGYPAAQEEMRILEAQTGAHPIDSLQPIVKIDELCALQRSARTVSVSVEVRKYIVDLVSSTRDDPDVRLGVSPRGSLALMHAAQAHAFVHGLGFVPPDSVKAVAPYVVAHRLILDPHREYTGLARQDIVRRLLEETPVPTLRHDQSATQVPG